MAFGVAHIEPGRAVPRLYHPNGADVFALRDDAGTASAGEQHLRMVVSPRTARPSANRNAFRQAPRRPWPVVHAGPPTPPPADAG
jgi:hypothetical protein